MVTEWAAHFLQKSLDRGVTGGDNSFFGYQRGGIKGLW